MPRPGFTLIELLVVMCIIAVLAAMLMPAIQMVRLSAQSATCQSQLRQLSIGVQSYTQDFDGIFDPQFVSMCSWMDLVAPYVDSEARTKYTAAMGNSLDRIPGIERLLRCPRANLPRAVGDAPWPTIPEAGTANRAWGNHANPANSTFNNHLGSYGFNTWNDDGKPLSTAAYPAERPLFVDSMWPNGNPAPQTDTVPVDRNQLLTGTTGAPWADTSTMHYFCLDRHGRRTNTVFVDGHAAAVALADLWMLRWSATSIPTAIVIP